MFVHKTLRLLAVVQPNRLFAITTKGKTRYDQVRYEDGDALMFGPETRGLPLDVRLAIPESQWLTIPMREGCRSLNLSNAVSVLVYEAWRQRDFIS